ncbi:voltage and ligand gated potassium channel, putative [Pediculus humanus corporis]|uniref:Voltage and ligand gated potassium channel, putative n=1 Tax=Pediculus humanus subsp. corporis TaxID=121224 RepID=E0VPP8_PEDHC|nr:voltage and ligand gated potassium channel, putative [Pediculus humanus corporis]EEB15354.1 voltage and ligand gated potassium channel, putative [Pediculus humanus corporis]
MKKNWQLLLDAISITPFSLVYLILEQNPNLTDFLIYRLFTLLRLYRCFSDIGYHESVELYYWSLVFFGFAFSLYVSINANASEWVIFVSKQDHFDLDIVDWNLTSVNKFIVAMYYSITTSFNVGFGDIVPNSQNEVITILMIMLLGFIMLTGILPGIITIVLANKESEREDFRSEYEYTMYILKRNKIQKKVIDKISNNLQIFWDYRKGVTSTNIKELVPWSLRREIFYDINFGFLNRSLIFSLQPRSFLRSVSLLMTNISFLPGDIVIEPYEMSEAMLCIASGVLEILSEENDETPLLSFTAGTILGEASLFLTIPNKYIIRASTFLELQVLPKKEFSKIALIHPEIYRSMRSEILHRINFIAKNDQNKFVNSNLDPDVQMTVRRKVLKNLQNKINNNEKNDDNTMISSFKTNVLNLYVVCENITRIKLLPLSVSKSKPYILRPNTPVLKYWRFFIVVSVSIIFNVYPFWASFNQRKSVFRGSVAFFMYLVFVADLFIQCVTAVQRPDNFTFETSIKYIVAQKLRTAGFYLDVIATFDLTAYSNFASEDNEEYALFLLLLNRTLKFWQVVKYFQDLENNFTINIYILRIFKYFFYYVSMLTWAASILHLEGCPKRICDPQRWFARVEAEEVEKRFASPKTAWPHVVSFYWGSVILTGLGFGDITPKTISDILVVLLCIFSGTALIIFCSAEAAVTIKFSQRSRRRFEKQVLQVTRFMIDHEISEELQNRVKNYFRTQWVYDHGYSIIQQEYLEKMPTQQREIILTQLLKKFLSVPIFHAANVNFLRFLAKSCKMRILPPHEVVTYIGSLASELYILENGYCEVTSPTGSKIVIGPQTGFGYVEMLLSSKLNINVMTLTHSKIISLDYAAFLRGMTRYSTVKAEIEAEMEQLLRNTDTDDRQNLGFNLLLKYSKGNERNTFIMFKECINMHRYCKNQPTPTSYWEPFKKWGKFRFFQFLLLPIVISPQSRYLKIWTCIRIVSIFILCSIAPLYFCLPVHSLRLEVTIYMIVFLSWLDIYIMFHVAYYDTNGLLMYHPAKTSLHYLKGSFLLDFLTSFPLYWLTQSLYPIANNSPLALSKGLGFIMVLQFYKFLQGCKYLERDALRPLSAIKILKFLPLSLIITNVITGFVILLQCQITLPKSEDLSKVLMREFTEHLELFCKPRSRDQNRIKRNRKKYFRFYVLSYYWVTTTLTTTGFGDLVPHSKELMLIIILVIIVGIFLYGYIICQITGSMMVANNEIIQYRRGILDMIFFLKQAKVNRDIQDRLIFHYQYNWLRTEGGSPEMTLTYLNAALRESIVADMYEEVLRKIPGFRNMEKSVIKVMGKYMKELYFLQGENIVNLDDVQEDIYLLYRGKVNID